MDWTVLTNLVNTSKLGGWVRATVGGAVGAGLTMLVAKWPALNGVFDPATKTQIATAAGTVASAAVIGVWSHVAKSLAAK